MLVVVFRKTLAVCLLLIATSALSAEITYSTISASTDVAEEQTSGYMYLTSTDVELVDEGLIDQLIGLRFNNVDVPQGAEIIYAYMQFTVDETTGSEASAILDMYAEDTDNAVTFSYSAYDISSRALTSASVRWDVPPWNTVDGAGIDQQTPDISPIIQEIIDREEWTALNSMAIIVTGTGTRTAQAFNGDSAKAPVLVVEYSTASPVYECYDGVDNDGDTLIDLVDPGCIDASDLSEYGLNECDDGIDNDEDGLFDLSDEGCIDLGGTDETNCGDSVCEGRETWQSCLDCAVPECSDGIDNDGDMLTDYLEDPGCSDEKDNDERDSLLWSFAAFGDTRSFYDPHSENVLAIVNKMPSRITVLNAGDITEEGTVDQWELWKDISAPLNIDTTKVDPPHYIGAVGSHDTEATDWLLNWITYLPAQRGLSAYLGTAGDTNGRYGSVKYQNALFVWVDSITMPAAQESFLEDTLIKASEDTELDWKFVMFHNPPIGCGGIHDDWSTGKTWHDNYFVPYDIDIVFLGHNHIYERTCPFTSANLKTCDEDNRGDLIGDTNGVIHVITGGGGAELYPTADCVWLDASAGVHHFLQIDIDGDNLRLRAWDTDNGGAENPTLIDDVIIDKLLYHDPPSVDAGPDQTITWPDNVVSLDGSVSDDGLPDPPGVTTSWWSQVSGPLDVVFGNPSAVDTTATFPGPGVYVLRLTADDSDFTVEDDVVVTVVDPSAVSVDIRVAASSDDAEENALGNIYLTSTDLEFTYDGTDQVVGMRFAGVAVPAGTTVTAAWLQFQVDEVNSVPTDLLIRAQAADDAATFTWTNGDITSRPLTAAEVAWSPAAWDTVGEAGPDQQTPDISTLVQEIVDRPGWAEGNAMVFIVSGSGERTAESYNGDSGAAPLLHIEYSAEPPPQPQPPVAYDDVVATQVDMAVTIDVAANDTDADGNLDPTSANTTCASCASPTNGTLVNNGDGTFTYTPDAGFDGPDSFVYEICDTLGACDTATVSITVSAAAHEGWRRGVTTLRRTPLGTST